MKVKLSEKRTVTIFLCCSAWLAHAGAKSMRQFLEFAATGLLRELIFTKNGITSSFFDIFLI